MSGVKIEITNAAGPLIDNAIGKLSRDGLRLMLSDIGEYMMRATRERAAAQIAPDGQPWAALSPRYKKRKDRKRPGLPMLRYDSHMLGDQLVWQVAGSSLRVGTRARYGALHQFGHTMQIPARSQQMYFKRERNGTVGNRFVNARRSNFAQWATLPAYEITIPARPWLGLSAEDEIEVKQIAADHISGLFE